MNETETLTLEPPINMELLAPAGGWEQLQAAIAFGADAVYLSTDRFGMRARAANFALDELSRAVDEAHNAGVRVYVTCNILMDAHDIAALPDYLCAVDAAGVDALIIGDLGAFSLARRYAPNTALHVSTQASVANAEAARVWHELGASRIVCAREMSLADIADLRANTPATLEIEAFVHGAQCMAVSGRCLISSYLTGRSGNKGHCTQPCRWNYTLEEEKRPGLHFPVEQDESGTFIMNAKDLNMLSHLRELEAAGVCSIKIEGRNKKAFYVASVVNAYRQVLDGVPADMMADELLAVSHRPYGTGFYFGEAEQACDYDGYEQECLHVADIISCEPLDSKNEQMYDISQDATNGAWLITVRCRNRFAEGETLEALVPHAPVQHLEVRKLNWLPDPSPNTPAPQPQAVAVANRASCLYRFEVDAPIPAGSFLRMRQFRRSARHDALSVAVS